jgi:hypothetical protein
MEKHSNLTDLEFEKQFKNCSLNPTLFSHEAHIRLAWIQVKKYGKEKAIQNICSQLASYVNFLGATGKYNITLTVAAVKAVYHFMQKSGAENFKDFIVQFPRLKYNFKELMAAHYKTDIFNSALAKKEFLMPDLLPFD